MPHSSQALLHRSLSDPEYLPQDCALQDAATLPASSLAYSAHFPHLLAHLLASDPPRVAHFASHSDSTLASVIHTKHNVQHKTCPIFKIHALFNVTLISNYTGTMLTGDGHENNNEHTDKYCFHLGCLLSTYFLEKESWYKLTPCSYSKVSLHQNKNPKQHTFMYGICIRYHVV